MTFMELRTLKHCIALGWGYKLWHFAIKAHIDHRYLTTNDHYIKTLIRH
jgi:hypothetical protein